MRPAARNLLSNYAAYAVSILAGLILTPVIIGAIGKEAFGAWAFILSLTTLLRLLDFGVTPTVIRFTALHRGRSEQTELDSLASTGLAVYLVAGLISVVAGLVLAWFLPDMIDLSPQLEGPAQVAVVLAALDLGTQAPLGLVGSLLKGAQRFDVLNTGAIISIVTYAVLVVLVLTEHPSIDVLATIALLATVVRLGFPVLFVRRELPGLRISLPSSASEAFDRCSATRGSHFVGHVAGKVVYSADVIVIGTVLGPEKVALYGVATRLFGLAVAVGATGTACCCRSRASSRAVASTTASGPSWSAGIRSSVCVAVLLAFPSSSFRPGS